MRLTGFVSMLVFTTVLMSGCATANPKATGAEPVNTASSSAPVAREPAAHRNCTAIDHPNEPETDFSPTGKLLQAQTTCTSANKVFNDCPHGAMYSSYENSSILDHSATLISTCEKQIARNAFIKKTYDAYMKKFCNFKSSKGSRSEVAKEDECDRDLAITFGELSERVGHN